MVLFFAALLPRLYVAIAWSKEPVWDGHYYHLGAERIASGLGYSEDVWSQGKLLWKPWVHYPVGYSGLLAALYTVFGKSPLIAPLLNAFAGALLAPLVTRLARGFLTPCRARVAGVLVAVHPGLVAYSALVMTEVVGALLLVLVGLSAYRYRGRWLGPVGSGLLIGLMTLLRPASLLLLPLIALTEPGPWRRRLRGVAIGSGCALLILLPWTLRNCARLDGCVLVSTNGGWNLAIGAITRTGRFETLRASDGCAVVTGQVQQDRCWQRVAIQKISRDPWKWLGLAPQKLAETFNHESFPIEYLHEADPVRWTRGLRETGREVLTLAHRLLLVAAAFGVVSRPRSRRDLGYSAALQATLLALIAFLALRAFQSPDHPFHWLILLIPVIGFLPFPGRPGLGAVGAYAVGALLGVIVTHAVFFGEDRYHLVVTPVLCLLAAAAFRTPASLPEGAWGAGLSPPARAPT